MRIGRADLLAPIGTSSLGIEYIHSVEDLLDSAFRLNNVVFTLRPETTNRKSCSEMNSMI